MTLATFGLLMALVCFPAVYHAEQFVVIFQALFTSEGKGTPFTQITFVRPSVRMRACVCVCVYLVSVTELFVGFLEIWRRSSLQNFVKQE